MTKEPYDKTKRSNIINKITKSRVVKSLILGLIITLVSLVIINFNLSTNSGIRITDDTNRYFDTCVGEFFTDTTPRIQNEGRGFPLSYNIKTKTPICNDRTRPSAEVMFSKASYFELGAFLANWLFWSCIVFMFLRSFIKKRHIKINQTEV